MRKFDHSSKGHFQVYEFIKVNLLICENGEFSFQMCYLVSCVLFGLTRNVSPIVLPQSLLRVIGFRHYLTAATLTESLPSTSCRAEGFTYMISFNHHGAPGKPYHSRFTRKEAKFQTHSATWGNMERADGGARIGIQDLSGSGITRCLLPCARVLHILSSSVMPSLVCCCDLFFPGIPCLYGCHKHVNGKEPFS